MSHAFSPRPRGRTEAVESWADGDGGAFFVGRSLIGNPAAGALLKVCHGSYTGLIVLSGTSVITGSFFMLLSKLRIDPNIFARV